MKTLKVTNVNLFKETQKAICVSFSYGWKIFDNVWLPKSQITINDRYQDTLDFNIPFWLVNKLKYTSDNSDSSSVWCDIFRKQDSNGLTNHGYSLD